MLTILLTIFTVQAEELNKKYQWETIPMIEICPESNVDIDHVYKALNYWQKETGFKYSEVKKVLKCTKEKINTIQITDGTDVDTSRNLGLTSVYHYHYSDNVHAKYVDYAIVKIPTNRSYEYLAQEIITHEMGHAIGYGHSSSGIMHRSMGH